MSVPFASGRGEALQEQTDVASFPVMEPKADAFCNYYSKESLLSPGHACDRASMLTMTVWWAVCALSMPNTGDSKNGVVARRVGTLSNDFLSIFSICRPSGKKSSKGDSLYEGVDRNPVP